MDPLRVIVVDDESLARRGLRLRLDSIDNVEILAECSNGLEAINKIAELEPDLIFLDIQMPKMNGFDVVSNLQQDNLPLIIFVTAFDEYAVEAFDIHAVDYLLKPIEPQRLEAAIERARSQHMSKRAPLHDRRPSAGTECLLSLA